MFLTLDILLSQMPKQRRYGSKKTTTCEGKREYMAPYMRDRRRNQAHSRQQVRRDMEILRRRNPEVYQAIKQFNGIYRTLMGSPKQQRKGKK